MSTKSRERLNGLSIQIVAERARHVRKAKVETSINVYGFLTTEPSAMVAPDHLEAMPMILTTTEDYDTWLRAPRIYVLKIVARGTNEILLARHDRGRLSGL
jgi:putative SOS response-associated peptidase YedK